MGKSPALSKEVSDNLMERVKSGESVYALAAEVNRHPANLYELLKRRYGFRFRDRNSYWPKTVEIPNDPAVRGYIAGIIDGEGSIKRRPDGLWSVVIVMTDEAVIRWFHGFGGGFGTYERQHVNRKTTYRWQVGRRADVLEVLVACAPYLIVKKSIAEEVISELSERLARSFQRNIGR